MSAIDSPRESCSSSPRRTTGVRAQLGDADLEGDPGAGRGLLEDEGDAAPGQRLAADAVAPARFQLERPVEQLAQLERPQLFACEEVSRQAVDTKRVQFTAIAWNLFHGRDFPPDPALFTWRSRLLRVSERNDTHLQVNRDLLDEFAAMLAEAEWDVALLQECPPRFAAPLARVCGAEAHRVLTSRNSLGPLRAAAARLNPDLIASGEGGSNLTLLRCSFTSHREARNSGTGGSAGSSSGATLVDPRGQARAPGDGLHPHRLRPLRRQPARDQRPPRAGRRGRAARRAHARPSGPASSRCSSAATSTCARPRRRRSSTSCASASASRADDRARARSTTCWHAAWRRSSRPPPGRRSGARRASDDRAIRLSDHTPVTARFEMS